MAKVKIENVGPEKVQKAKVELTAEEKKLPKDDQDRIRTEREQQLRVDEFKNRGDLLTVEVIESQYNAHTGGDQDKSVDSVLLEPGESKEFELTDKKRVSVRFT